MTKPQIQKKYNSRTPCQIRCGCVATDECESTQPINPTGCACRLLPQRIKKKSPPTRFAPISDGDKYSADPSDCPCGRERSPRPPRPAPPSCPMPRGAARSAQVPPSAPRSPRSAGCPARRDHLEQYPEQRESTTLYRNTGIWTAEASSCGEPAKMSNRISSIASSAELTHYI